ncbi:MAG: hypothetical protein KME64_28390 [Scytonematopsis contorta HA4267-MV1]|jgi:hypothetical protein|nr:hypothetical protein [Scytonematopsis contorta HA4267-MV1]
METLTGAGKGKRDNTSGSKGCNTNRIPCIVTTVEFLYLIEALITKALDQLHKEVQALIKTQQNLPFDPNIIESILIASLPLLEPDPVRFFAQPDDQEKIAGVSRFLKRVSPYSLILWDLKYFLFIYISQSGISIKRL